MAARQTRWRQQGKCSDNSNIDPVAATAANLTDFHWVFHVGLCWIFHMGFPLDLVFIDFGLDLEWVFQQVWIAVVIVGLCKVGVFLFVFFFFTKLL